MVFGYLVWLFWLKDAEARLTTRADPTLSVMADRLALPASAARVGRSLSVLGGPPVGAMHVTKVSCLPTAFPLSCGCRELTHNPVGSTRKQRQDMTGVEGQPEHAPALDVFVTWPGRLTLPLGQAAQMFGQVGHGDSRGQ